MTESAMQRLAEGNPVPAAMRAWIAEELELDSIRPGLPPRWRRRPVALTIAALTLFAAAVLLVAPALGFGIPGIDFFKAEKAPPRVVKSFADLGLGAPPGMDPNVIPDETRKVMTTTDRDGYGWVLWVAPTREGGLCFDWERTRKGNGFAGCDREGTVPLSVTWSRPATFGPAPRYEAHDFERVAGYAHARSVDDVEIHLTDGEKAKPKMTWVSAPINAGFFFYEPPEKVFVRSVVGLRNGRPVIEDDGAPSPPVK